MDMGKQKHQFSIIIPVHNAEKTLRGCVESILASQYPALQVILVENNSSDASWPLCCALQSEYAQVECVQTNQIGVSAARNLGLQKVTGDIVGFCDADDQYIEGCLHILDEVFHSEPFCSAVVTGYYVQKADGTNRPKHMDKRRLWQFSELAAHVLYDNRIMGSVWNKFFRKDVILGCMFDEMLSYCEDMHFVMKALTTYPDKQAVILNTCTYVYCENEESATASKDRLFTSDNKLKYTVALDKILQDCQLQSRMRRLVGRAKYQIAYQCKCQFSIDKEKQRALSCIMKENFRSYLLTSDVDILKTMKVLIKQILGR